MRLSINKDSPFYDKEKLNAHVAQGILACRVARKADPDTWPTHS